MKKSSIEAGFALFSTLSTLIHVGNGAEYRPQLKRIERLGQVCLNLYVSLMVLEVKSLWKQHQQRRWTTDKFLSEKLQAKNTLSIPQKGHFSHHEVLNTLSCKMYCNNSFCIIWCINFISKDKIWWYNFIHIIDNAFIKIESNMHNEILWSP